MRPVPIAIAIAAAFPVAGFAQATVAGITKGVVAVTPGGAATYQLPIFVSRGSGGMQPSISLAYSSKRGDDIAGFGWGLSGFSGISRCAKTFFQDDVLDPVHLNNQDRFCLDGQRLVGVKGTYGGDGSEYRTEVDSGLRIFSFGSDGTGPSWWRVDARDGTQRVLGDTEATRLRLPAEPLLGAAFSGAPSSPFPSTPPIQQWLERQVSDSAGNYMTFEYLLGSHAYPTSVKYTGNSRQGTGTYQDVVMEYEDRPKVTTKYSAGTAGRLSKRLSKIKARGVGGATIKEYRLAYDSSSPDNWRSESRLTSVTECTGDGAECLLPTTFGYTDFSYEASVQQDSSSDVDAGYDSGRAWADMNGDGFADYCRVVGDPPTVRMEPLPPQPRTVCDESGCYTVYDEGGWQTVTEPGSRGAACRLSAGSYFSSTEASTSSSGFSDIDWGIDGARWWIDFNADGKSDFCRFVDTGSGYKLKCNLSNGGGFDGAFETPNTMNTGWVYAGGWPDFNGDGRPDFCRMVDGPKRVACTTSAGNAFGSEYVSPPVYSASHPYFQTTVEEVLIGDVNGDGRADFCWPATDANNQIGLSCTQSTGSGFTEMTHWTESEVGPIGRQQGRALVDVNGDGLADFCRVADVAGGSRAYCTLSNGDGWTAIVDSGAIDVGYDEFRQWADVNGDGDADFCRLVGDGATKQAQCRMTNDGTFSTLEVPIGVPGVATYAAGRSFADFDGDGKLDYCNVRGGGNGPASYTLTCNRSAVKGPQNLLRTIIEGPGGAYQFSYAPLTDYTVYPWRTTTSYPFVAYVAPEYVVKELVSDNGISASSERLNPAGSPFDAKYYYYNGQIHLLGGGFLGFQVNSVADAQAQTVTETWNTTSNEFPFHGLPFATLVFRWGQYNPYRPAKEVRSAYTTAGYLPLGLYGVDSTAGSTAYKSDAYRSWLDCGGVASSIGGRLRRSLPGLVLESTNEPGIVYDPSVPGSVPTPPATASRTVTNYDVCGNATLVERTQVVPDGSWVTDPNPPSTGESVSTLSDFQNDITPTRWHLGRLLRATTTMVKP